MSTVALPSTHTYIYVYGTRRTVKPSKLRPYEGTNLEWVDTPQVDTEANYRVADPFAGAGGLGVGLKMAGDAACGRRGLWTRALRPGGPTDLRTGREPW